MQSKPWAESSWSLESLKSIQSTLKTSNSSHQSSNLQKAASSIKTTMSASKATTLSSSATGRLVRKSSRTWTVYASHSKRCSIKVSPPLIKLPQNKRAKISSSNGRQPSAPNWKNPQKCQTQCPRWGSCSPTEGWFGDRSLFLFLALRPVFSFSAALSADSHSQFSGDTFLTI